MVIIVFAALLWVGVHVGIAGTELRRRVVARLGDNGFRAAFSGLSLLSMVALVMAYRRADSIPIWFAPTWLRWVLVAAMLPTAMLLVASLSRPNPTAVGSEAALGRPVTGITRVTRHPMLWAFALWAGVHIIGNGDTAALVFFGAFLATAVAGMPSIDAKIAACDPQHWPAFAAVTSIIPGAAILSGRNRFVAAEIGWLVPLGGSVLWLALLFGHQHVIGVAPVPGLPG